MATRGFLIRFIDIGLIVLFGFLMISDIDMLSRVELASEAFAIEVEVPPDPEVRASIVVLIGADGRFHVDDSRQPEALPAVVASKADLAAQLTLVSAMHVRLGLETVVLIQPHEASVVQSTVDVMDVCDSLSLPKSLQMDIEVEAASDPDPPGAP